MKTTIGDRAAANARTAFEGLAGCGRRTGSVAERRPKSGRR